MKIESCLIDRDHPEKKTFLDLDLPALPSKGDCIIIGEAENYEVTGVIFCISDDRKHCDRITVDAKSLWNI